MRVDKAPREGGSITQDGPAHELRDPASPHLRSPRVGSRLVSDACSLLTSVGTRTRLVHGVVCKGKLQSERGIVGARRGLGPLVHHRGCLEQHEVCDQCIAQLQAAPPPIAPSRARGRIVFA